MKRNKTRITESQLLNMIQDAVYEAVNEGKIKDKFKDLSRKAGKEVKNLFDPKRFGKIIDDLTDMDKDVVDNPRFQEKANGLDESRLRGMIREAVKNVLKENVGDYEVTLPDTFEKVKVPFGTNMPDIFVQATVNDLIETLQDYGGGNERVQVFDGKNGFSTVYAVIGSYLFLSEMDLKNYLQREMSAAEEYRNHNRGGGEGLRYGPSDMPAGWQ